MAFLSQRAVDRRNAHGIAIDQSDLPVDPIYIQKVSNITGVTILNHSKWFNSVTVELTSPSILSSINALPFVLSSVLVGRPAGTGETNINKYNLNEQGPVLNSFPSVARLASFNYGNAQNQTSMININALHDLGFSGQGMIIAVIDGGFQLSHTDLKFRKNYNEIPNNSSKYNNVKYV